MLSYVDHQVDNREKEHKLFDIYNKLDARQSTMFKGKKFKVSSCQSTVFKGMKFKISNNQFTIFLIVFLAEINVCLYMKTYDWRG